MSSVVLSGSLPAGMDAKTLQKLLRLTLKQGGREGDWQVSLAVVSEVEIRRLNRQFRGRNRVTDVLSFGHARKERVPAGPEEAVLGDVVICSEQVRRQAKQADRPVAAEFALLFVHGLLHLMGFDHDTPRRERHMFGLQQDILMAADIF